MRLIRCLLTILALALLLSAIHASPASSATRHHMYIGTITSITGSTLVIYSKTHHTTYRFVVDSQTKFLKSGKAISRLLFKAGCYVTVSYDAGSHGTLVAWHVSLRK